jgi:clan AA aspartic protease
MITGTVNGRLEMMIVLPVRDSGGRDQAVECLLDTGFTGSLTLPSSLIRSLGLSWRSRSSAVLANGRVEHFDVFAAVVVWDGVARPILVQAIENPPLLGMALLRGFELRAHVVAGGTVVIGSVA